MGRINIVTSASRSFISHAGVMLLSLFENNRGLDFNVYILYDGIKRKDTRKLISVGDFFGHKIFFHQIDIAILRTFPISVHASVANYFRILIPDILPGTVKRAFYFDADVLVLKSIVPLIKVDISKCAVAVVNTPSEERIRILEIDPRDGYFNSGVMVMNIQKWRDENISTKLLKYIATNPDKIKFWDQDALNKMLAKDKIVLDSRWNVCDEEEIDEINNVGILHFVGPYKPWHIRCAHGFRYLYHEFRMKSPWKPIRFRELGSYHKIKQALKQLFNKAFGTKMDIYQYDNFSS